MIKNNIKRFLNVVIILIVTMFIIAISESTANAANNTSGAWEYRIVSGSITPSGAEITKYNGSESYVEIPEIIDGQKVIGLTNNIFENNITLTKVSIPAYVEWIGDSSFAGCTNLITVNNNSTMLNKISSYAFYNCISLRSFVLPKVSSSTAIYTSIGYEAFYNCQSLATLEINASKFSDCNSSRNTFYDAGAAAEGGLQVIFSDDVTNIPAYMFSCNSDHYARVTNVEIGKNVKSIGEEAFANCADLKIVTNNSTKLDTIGNYAFCNCKSLKSFVLPKVSSSTAIYTSIGYEAFYNCQSLATLEINASKFSDCNSSRNTFYDAGAAAEGGLQVIFSDDVTNIPAYMFSCNSDHYARVTNVEIGKNVKSIGEEAFANCADLKTVTNNSTMLYSIGNYAFCNCISLNAFMIPSTTTSVGYEAFFNCQSLATLKVYAVKLSDCNSSRNTFYDAGAAAEGGLQVIFSDDVTNIPAYMFSCNSDHYARVTNVEIGKNVKSIGEEAFANCADLKTVTNNSIKLDTIGNYAFYNCSSLNAFMITSTTTSIGYEAFYSCFGLTSIRFNSATTTIYDSADTIPVATKIIGYNPSTAKTYATKYNRTFEVIVVPTTLQSIGITTPATKLSYNIGDSLDITGLVVTGTYSDGSTKVEPIAAANVTGFNSAVATTDQVLTITVSDKTTTYKVQIVALPTIKVTKVSINKKTTSIIVGSNDTLIATISPTTATNQNVTWKSSKTSIATVDSNGKVVGVSAGTAVITVTSVDGKKTATCKVTVKNPPTVKVTKVSLNKKVVAINVGANETLITTVSPTTATNQKVTWKSSKTSVATVDSNGNVVGVSAGTAVITVTSVDGKKTATCKVTVKSAP